MEDESKVRCGTYAKIELYDGPGDQRGAVGVGFEVFDAEDADDLDDGDEESETEDPRESDLV